VQAALTRAIQTGTNYRCRFRVLGRDNHLRWVVASAKPFFDANGKVSRLLGVIVEVTNQVATASALAESRFQFQTLTETLPQIVWSCDAEGRHDYFSHRWSEFTGVSPDTITAETWKQLVYPDDQPRVLEVWDRSRATGQSYDIEYRFRHHSGEYRWLRVMALPMRDEEGCITRWFGTSTDIHDARVMAEERQRLAGELEQNIVRLDAAREKAEAAERAKSEFLAIVTHEIRTPMNGVLSIAALLAQSKLDASQREMADTIQTSAHSLLSIINDILDFSKIEAGKLEITPLAFSLSDSIDHVIRLLGPLAAHKGITLAPEIDPSLRTTHLWGDEGRLRQVITNLIGNALKFTQPDGTVTIRAHARSQSSSAITVRVSVHDTGIGIPPEVQAKLFHPFSQADATTAQTYGGSGLGLSICRQLISLMGGEIGLNSSPKHGSEFWFELSLEKRAFQETLPLHPSGKSVPTRSSRALYLLVADDNAINRSVAGRLLTAMGHRVELVADGTDVLKRVAERTYDAIFMDFRMANLDGYETTRRIRAGGDGIKTPQIWIIGLSAAATGQAREECLAVGMNDFVSKPIIIEDLAAALERAINSLPANRMAG
jgi:two-component system sensor histidine kinase/response regulator